MQGQRHREDKMREKERQKIEREKKESEQHVDRDQDNTRIRGEEQSAEHSGARMGREQGEDENQVNS